MFDGVSSFTSLKWMKLVSFLIGLPLFFFAQLGAATWDEKVEKAFDIYYGYETPYDGNYIFETFKAGVDVEHPRAMGGLGLCYWRGIKVPSDHKKALFYMEKAKNAEDPLGTCYYGLFVRDGTGGIPKDRDKGREYVEKALKMGYSYAEVHLLQSKIPKYVKKKKTKDELEALKRLEVLVEEDKNAFAAFVLGQYYDGGNHPYYTPYNGKTINNFKEVEKALHYLKISAEGQYAGAMNRLALIAKQGRKGKFEVPKNLGKAVYWYRKATHRNNTYAQLELADILRRNKNLREDGEDWYKYLLDAYDIGSEKAKIELGLVNFHCPGYSFRDLSWKKTAFYYESFLDNLRERGERWYSMEHWMLEHLCKVYFEGGLGLDRDLKKCLEHCIPYLGESKYATGYAGRVLLHQKAPFQLTRDDLVRGYACILRAQKMGFGIHDDGLFVLRSRHSLSREEVAQAEKMIKNGFPKPGDKLVQ